MLLQEVKKGGPYTKNERKKRRDEVYKLHFEYGDSARKIAEFLNINRATINQDITYWYSDVVKKWNKLDPAIYVVNQIERLELQRTRLRKQLDNVESFNEKITIEKFILNIEMKIINFQMNLLEAIDKSEREIAKRINEMYEKDGFEKRVVSSNIFLEVSKKASKKICDIYYEDKKL